jgi:hypothetical protein
MASAAVDFGRMCIPHSQRGWQAQDALAVLDQAVDAVAARREEVNAAGHGHDGTLVPIHWRCEAISRLQRRHGHDD